MKYRILIHYFLLLTTFNIFSQSNKVEIFDKDYNKVLEKEFGDVMPSIDSLYNTNNKFYNAFYLVNKKDTLFIRRNETYVKIKKLKEERI